MTALSSSLHQSVDGQRVGMKTYILNVMEWKNFETYHQDQDSSDVDRAYEVGLCREETRGWGQESRLARVLWGCGRLDASEVRWSTKLFFKFFKVVANRVGVWGSDKKFIRNSNLIILNFLFCAISVNSFIIITHHHLPFEYSAVSVPVQIHSYSIITTFGKQRCGTLGWCYKDVVPHNWPRTWGLGMNEWRRSRGRTAVKLDAN